MRERAANAAHVAARRRTSVVEYSVARNRGGPAVQVTCEISWPDVQSHEKTKQLSNKKNRCICTCMAALRPMAARCVLCGPLHRVCCITEVAPGTGQGSQQRSVERDAATYGTDVEEFVPERWMETDGDAQSGSGAAGLPSELISKATAYRSSAMFRPASTCEPKLLCTSMTLQAASKSRTHSLQARVTALASSWPELSSWSCLRC
eukprot:355136-Chlamydomonas_euryale.AAC.9